MADAKLPPCPAGLDFYEDGVLRCCREEGHEGWHRPSRDVWRGVKEMIRNYPPRLHPTAKAVLVAAEKYHGSDDMHGPTEEWAQFCEAVESWRAAGRPGAEE